MLELLFWLMLVDLVLDNGSGRKSRERIMVSLGATYTKDS